MLAAQASRPEFKPRNPCGGGKNEVIPQQWSYDSVAVAHTHIRVSHSIIITRLRSLILLTRCSSLSSGGNVTTFHTEVTPLGQSVIRGLGSKKEWGPVAAGVRVSAWGVVSSPHHPSPTLSRGPNCICLGEQFKLPRTQMPQFLPRQPLCS